MRFSVQTSVLFGLLFCEAAVAAPVKVPQKAETAALCARIKAVGCCLEGQLLYCDSSGTLKTLDCRKRPRCGWRASGRYDCDTAGQADPSDAHPRFCPLGGGKLTSDLGVRRPQRPCGAIKEEGCCTGHTLRLCDNGELREIDCRANRFCGWRGVAQAYNCGTDGKPDPRGNFPMACPDSPPPALAIFPDQGPKTGLRGASAHKGGCGGCRCDLGSSGPGAVPVVLVLLLAWLLRRGSLGA